MDVATRCGAARDRIDREGARTAGGGANGPYFARLQRRFQRGLLRQAGVLLDPAARQACSAWHFVDEGVPRLGRMSEVGALEAVPTASLSGR